MLVLSTGPLTFEPGEHSEQTWRVGRGTRVHGVLLTEEGAPLPGREIWLSRELLMQEIHRGRLFIKSYICIRRLFSTFHTRYRPVNIGDRNRPEKLCKHT